MRTIVRSPPASSSHVEEVAGERGKPPGLSVDDLEIAPLLVRREVPLEQQRGETEHRGERRAQLVRDHADQVALVTLALAQLLVLEDQLVPPELERARHRVERRHERADLGGAARLEPHRQVAARDLRGPLRDPAHRPRHAARDPGAEQQHERRRDDDRRDPDANGRVDHLSRMRRGLLGPLVLRREQLVQRAVDLPDPPLCLAAGSRPARAAPRETDAIKNTLSA